MWRLKSVTARNLMSFRELEYTLQQGVTTLIFGNNQDNDSQKSNGSGKSALIEAIAIGIIGSPMRKVKLDEVINDTCEDGSVSLVFDNDSSTEVFYIDRDFFRKGSSAVSTRIERDGQMVTTDEAVKSSVDEYNKYILEKLGVSKDEVFNNFILSESKYKDFLSLSDNDKKDIINTFSNGISVDIAIQKLQEDREPVLRELSEAELILAKLEGKVETLTDQITEDENSKESKAKSRSEKKDQYTSQIAQKRESVRDSKESIESINDFLDKLEAADCEVQKIENSDAEMGIEECVKKIVEILEPLKMSGSLTDWNGLISTKKSKIEILETENKSFEDKLEPAKEALISASKEQDKLLKTINEFNESYDVEVAGFNKLVDESKKCREQIAETINQLTTKKRSVNAAINNLKDKLSGTITCPKCKHEFILAEDGFDVLDAKIQITKKQEEISSIDSKIKENETEDSEVVEIEGGAVKKKTELNRKQRELEESLNNVLSKVNRSKNSISSIQNDQQDTINKISAIQSEISGIRERVFNDVYNIIDDKIKSDEKKIESLNCDIASYESSIEVIQKAIEDLENASDTELTETLKASLKKAKKDSNEAYKVKADISKEVEEFNTQEKVFIEFKTYLANTKIEALSQVTNEFLENIGSDIRINFSGYTVLKSGKIRDKISVSLVRDGIDCGSFAKFSKGEKARVNLANILAMNKLINVNCEEGKGIDLLVLDEVLDGSDEDGLAHIFDALNNLGITVLVVSHGKIAENYPYRLVVSKQNGESKIQ